MNESDFDETQKSQKEQRDNRARLDAERVRRGFGARPNGPKMSRAESVAALARLAKEGDDLSRELDRLHAQMRAVDARVNDIVDAGVASGALDQNTSYVTPLGIVTLFDGPGGVRCMLLPSGKTE